MFSVSTTAEESTGGSQMCGFFFLKQKFPRVQEVSSSGSSSSDSDSSGGDGVGSKIFVCMREHSSSSQSSQFWEKRAENCLFHI